MPQHRRGRVTGGRRLHFDIEFDAGEPLQLFGEDFGLEQPLPFQCYVPEFRAAHGRTALAPGGKRVGERPEMARPVV